MPNFIVTYGDKEVVLSADSPEHAKQRSIPLFSIKYGTQITFIETDDITVIEEVSE